MIGPFGCSAPNLKPISIISSKKSTLVRVLALMFAIRLRSSAFSKVQLSGFVSIAQTPAADSGQNISSLNSILKSQKYIFGDFSA